MRCVVDLQGAQNESRFRGIGRYCGSLIQAMARRPRSHELWLALSTAFADQVERIRIAFDELVPRERILLFEVPTPCSEWDAHNDWRARAAEKLRESFLEALHPDVVFVPSLFEGWCDDSVTSVGSFTQKISTAVVLYDLIPLLRPTEYLPDPRRRAWYDGKLHSLRAAELLTAISESARREAIEKGRVSEDRVVTIGCGVDPQFRPKEISAEERGALRKKHGITRDFIMYSGAADPRKNLEGLIAAFGLLPEGLKNTHQLVIAGAHSDREREPMRKQATDTVPRRDSIIFTGYVPDHELVALYNECALFVLPSFHEGFGLPAAEAMACGAPTIGSDASSIPEVLGRRDALFDPQRPSEIAAKMEAVLTNKGWQHDLRTHGVTHSKRFSWDNCAEAAWNALEELHERKFLRPNGSTYVGHKQKRLAYFSPLPPVPSGIADYSVELLPELARYYEIDAIVFQSSVSDNVAGSIYSIRTLSEFEANPHRYERILYHMGNSPFHTHMWRAMERYPGTVVLHDFYQSNLLNWIERDVGVPGAFGRALYRSHGYSGLLRDIREGRDSAILEFPCNRHVLDAAAGIIVHSHHSIELARKWYGTEMGRDWATVPHPRSPQARNSERARERLGFGASDHIVCSFGMIGDCKLNHRLLEAWSQSSLTDDTNCKLVFVGEMHGGEYGRQLLQKAQTMRRSSQVQFTGWANVSMYRDYLAAADQAVQLRNHSRGETSRAVFDCLSYGVPTVVNAHGTLSDLPREAVFMLADEFDDDELVTALEALRHSPELRRQFSSAGETLIRTRHAPASVAEQYWKAIEGFAQNHPRVREEDLVGEIRRIESAMEPIPSDLVKTAAAMAGNRLFLGPRRLLLDISATAKHDLNTGIERVAKAITMESIANPPDGFRIEPVRVKDNRCLHARDATLRMVGADVEILETPMAIRPGDVYLALDWSPEAVCSNGEFFDELRARGVRICFVVYDLLPLKLPHRFPPGTDKLYLTWLEKIVRVGDKLIADSRAVADELFEWLDTNQSIRTRVLDICYWHPGGDIAASAPTRGLPPGAEQVLSAMGARRSFLMVGTMEPRKGHTQVLAAFEQLWASGADLNLVIVGKQGWMMEALAQKIQRHREFGTRLFWLAGISDEMLLRVYENATALIAASEGEGFGLPLIEAARANVPIIARALPVFREVAGEGAFYFEGETAKELTEALWHWLKLSAEGTPPKPDSLVWTDWKRSTQQLLRFALGDECYRTWPTTGNHATAVPGDPIVAVDDSAPQSAAPS